MIIVGYKSLSVVIHGRRPRDALEISEDADNSRKFKAQHFDAPYLFPSKISFRLKYLLYTQRYVHSRYDFSLKCLARLRYGRHIECSYSPGASERKRG